MGWTDLSAAFAYGSKLTSAQMQNLRDNLDALAAGNSGAPRIVNAAITSHTITWQRLAAASASDEIVGQCNSVMTGAGPNYHYEVFAADGNWYRCSEDISP